MYILGMNNVLTEYIPSELNLVCALQTYSVQTVTDCHGVFVNSGTY